MGVGEGHQGLGGWIVGIRSLQGKIIAAINIRIPVDDCRHHGNCHLRAEGDKGLGCKVKRRQVSHFMFMTIRNAKPPPLHLAAAQAISFACRRTHAYTPAPPPLVTGVHRPYGSGAEGTEAESPS